MMNAENNEGKTMTRYYAITNINGPLSLRLGEHADADAAQAAYEACEESHSEDDELGRSWTDSARCDVEDDLGLTGCDSLGELEFDARLLNEGMRMVRPLGPLGGVWLWDDGDRVRGDC